MHLSDTLDHWNCLKLKYPHHFGKLPVVKPRYKFMDDKNASVQSDGSGRCFSYKFMGFKQ